MRSKTRSAALAAVCAGVLVLAACGDDSSDESSGETTITWWHNSNNEPGKGFYEQVAKDFEAMRSPSPAFGRKETGCAVPRAKARRPSTTMRVTFA